jgi:hypothetical protein
MTMLTFIAVLGVLSFFLKPTTFTTIVAMIAGAYLYQLYLATGGS